MQRFRPILQAKPRLVLSQDDYPQSLSDQRWVSWFERAVSPDCKDIANGLPLIAGLISPPILL